MDCNKEEALKAKQIAELKVAESDFNEAKRFALKAQNLYPELDGLPQFLATLDVYISAEKGPNGEVNWYKVLGVEPLADEDRIQKQFRKLALVLHPDKNKSVGAEGAFKIISNARRILYDQKQILSSMHDGIPDGFHDLSEFNHANTRDERIATPTMPDGKSSMPTTQNGFEDAFKKNHSDTRDERRATPTKPLSTSRPQKGRKTTFWTICSWCKMYFEYLRRFLNHKLQCHSCQKHFIAYKIPAPKNASMSSPFDAQQHKSQPTMPNNSCDPGRTHIASTDVRSSGISGVDKPMFAPGRTHPSAADVRSSGISGVDEPMFAPGWTHAAATDVGSSGISGLCFNSARDQSVEATASSSSQAAGSAHPAFRQLNRGHEESFPYKEAHQWKFHAFKKPDPFLPTGSPNTGFSAVPNGVKPRRKRHRWQEIQTKVGMGNGGVTMNKIFGSSKFSFGAGRLDGASRHRVNCTRDLSHVELQNVLVKKATKEIVKKLDKSSIPSVPKTVDANEVKKKGEKEADVPGVKADMTGCRVSVDAEDMPRKMSSPAKSHDDSDVEEGNTNSMSVPDPDFHDFDEHRTEKSFASNQVWAVYDEDDGMPRYYAMIHSIISLKPFKIQISWLNSKTNHELAPLDWVACGFPKTSGDLRIGKHGVYKYLQTFSHKVKWTKGRRGAVRIYPGKGDVWALYRNWSPDWDEHTPDEVIHKYDMVQVLEDYNEEIGVSIVPLVKVAGFKTVFRQHSDRSRIRTIPREEMFRFSHQVPYYLLTGLEGDNAPKGCLELDPASTPLELLQIKSEAQAKMEETAGKCNGEENGKVTIETGPVEDAEEQDPADLMKRQKDPQATKWRVYSRKRPREGQAVEGAKRLRL
ncbi:putative transcription factor C2H2 family [Rosa chinensis]|uniref:Putative transcription factor C2H2 family n=1 Tax=Rosa chinensis TaxID=74649 RepID=A0A2P6P4W8_ROSCH|nr:uncharacterized protein LOC112179970 [Rosa chinensis]PRQ16973.1 putative transcription factor C2H2 family [Rosa chinensis]